MKVFVLEHSWEDGHEVEVHSTLSGARLQASRWMLQDVEWAKGHLPEKHHVFEHMELVAKAGDVESWQEHYANMLDEGYGIEEHEVHE